MYLRYRNGQADQIIEMQTEYLEHADVLFLLCTNLRACKEIFQDKLRVITGNEAIIKQLRNRVGGGMLMTTRDNATISAEGVVPCLSFHMMF